jgi:ATP-dependent DNA helicase RecG
VTRPAGARPSPPAPGRTLRSLSELPVSVLETLSPKKAAALADWGVDSVLDLVTTYPRRHLDRTHRAELADLAVGDEAVVMAEVRRVNAPPSRNRRSRVVLEVSDESGGTLTIVFFNQSWRAKQLAKGTEALFFGKVTEYRGTPQMVMPAVDVIVGVDDESAAHRRRTLRVIPIYPASAKAGLTSWEIGTWVAEALDRAKTFADPLDDEWRERLDVVDRTTALWGIHLPDTMAEVAPARRRLVFDELFRLQLSLVLRRRSLERDARAVRHSVSPLDVTAVRGPADAGQGSTAETETSLVREFLLRLPFELTGAQRRALAVIFADLAGPLPMHRLLQGDVGSGKTVVAVASLLASVQGGHQGALMVPTEVLAEQHFSVVSGLLGSLDVADPGHLEGRRPVRVNLLTNRTTARQRAKLHAGLSAGEIDIVVGTHALLTDDVTFASLGVVVIDEQHRFGVEQRAALREKGRSGHDGEGADPDLLVMTATPIPRTAAMVVFGDLDMTTLDELPPGRTPITTLWARAPLDELAAWEKVRAEVAAGRRAYVVCPLVEGSDRVVARSAVDEFERLSSEVLPGLALGLLHGQMPAANKEATMAAFRRGEIQVLVATTVIEVGVDVPEATVMVVENADRFGIAQLHQLRGRVGRGSDQSWCYLLAEAPAGDAPARLEALEATTDGFELAEVDLELRGEGTILGVRQKGRSDLRLARLRRDRALLDEARRVAESITEHDPLLADHAVLQDEIRLFLDDDEAAFLFKS